MLPDAALELAASYAERKHIRCTRTQRPTTVTHNASRAELTNDEPPVDTADRVVISD